MEASESSISHLLHLVETSWNYHSNLKTDGLNKQQLLICGCIDDIQAWNICGFFLSSPPKAKSESSICSTFLNSPNVSVLDFSVVLSLMGSNVKGKHVVLVNKWWQAPMEKNISQFQKETIFENFHQFFSPRKISSCYSCHPTDDPLPEGNTLMLEQCMEMARDQENQRWGAARLKSLIVLAFGESPMIGNNEKQVFSKRFLDRVLAMYSYQTWCIEALWPCGPPKLQGGVLLKTIMPSSLHIVLSVFWPFHQPEFQFNVESCWGFPNFHHGFNPILYIYLHLVDLYSKCR